jgi:pilus assembly protein Flp/PilA
VKNLVERVRRLGTRRDDGASAVEYGLLVALIAVVIAGAVALLGTTLRGTVEESCRKVATTADAADDCAP